MMSNYYKYKKLMKLEIYIHSYTLLFEKLRTYQKVKNEMNLPKSGIIKVSEYSSLFPNWDRNPFIIP